MLSGPERIVVVHGPRLSGKTTLLGQWRAADASRAVDTAGVLDPVPDLTGDRYWQRVAHSLSSKRREYDDRSIPPIDPAPVDLPRGHFDEVKRLVRSWRGPLVLVLDDLHLAGDPEPRARELLQHAPPGGLRVIAATRTAMSRHGSSGAPADTVSVTPKDLLLTDVELTAAIDHAGVTATDRIQLGAIAVETGRMAGLVDVGVDALRSTGSSRASPVGPVRRGIDRVVVRVLAGDPELVGYREDIVRTAVATPLTESAAAVAIGGDGEGEGQTTVIDRLAAFERHGLVVRETDAPEPTWCYPDPIRASILRVAKAETPGLLRDTRLALSDHWLELGRPHTAFVHAIDAENWDRVLEILRNHWRTLYTTTFLQMDGDLRRIPVDILDSEPLFGSLRRMHSQFSAPKDSPARPPSIETSSDVPDDAERLMRMISLRIDGRFSDAAAECGPLSRIPEPEASTRSARDGPAFAFLHVGLSLMLVGRFDDANQMLRRGHRLGSGTFIERDAAGKLTLANAVLGHLVDAESWWDEERRHPQLPPDSELVVRPAGMIGAALARLDRLDTDSAIGLITDLGAPADREELWGFALYVYGQIALTTGTAADGLRYVEHQMRRFPGWCGNGAVAGPLLDAVRADLHLALGRSDASTELVGDSSHPLTAPVRARTRLYDGDHDGALELVRRHDGDLRCTQRDSLELNLVGAAASVGISARRDAVRYLERAVTTSTLTGVVRPFTTLPHTTMATLAELGPELPVAAHGTGTGSPSSPHEVTALTGREHAILRSLETGDSISTIADSHFVSVNTVKTQLRSVYRKLGTRSRGAAVEKARRLGLL
ncbi:helix-turn-helix transcriptional regulator [Dietzia sp. PP-33]|jgi:LuxR family maltose regulon positive regulatory protein|uniref:helix-turn-helix transcriptional regulator n=1 Tax=Dietzia sp. PP-33 TaxID=2957500 RepID=UPI0029AF9FC8|nr:LuxR C-terminal-related transcriptional regulator [Dietzia sp. PP-33]MDX2358328.1 LuxR C-terminal-related transcriptional regulator [Dietzia sp. PP-33]